MKSVRAAASVVVLLLLARGAVAQPCTGPGCAIPLPPGGGAIDVRAFGAKGDGITDDTDAIRRALTASGGDTGDRWWHDRPVWLPAGTYLVSGTLAKRYENGKFASGFSLRGEGPGRTVLRLADHAPGFDDRRNHRAVVMTTSKLIDTGGSRDYVGKGEGNDAYENFVEDLTIDTGEGNPGADGIDFLANNLGAVRNVVIRGRADSAGTGISMLRQVPGPALIQSVEVQGFQTGIAIRHTEYGMTLSDVSLVGQGATGLSNDGNVISAERLTIRGAGRVAIDNHDGAGLITLVDSTIDGPVVNRGTLSLDSTRAPVAGAPGGAILSGTQAGDGPWVPSTRRWSVPRVKIAPVDPGPVRDWALVPGSTETEPVDSTPALQRAFDSGARTIVLRHGTFWLSDTIRVPTSVRRVIGMNSTLRVFAQRRPGFSHEAPMIRVGDGAAPLQIEHLAMDNSNLGGQVGIASDGSRPLLLRDIVSAGVVLLRRGPAGGPAALEDVCCGPIELAGAAPVTIRQLDTEGGGIRVQNRGAPLSIIGLKTEQEGLIVQTTDGGRTEVLGGLVYLVNAPSPNIPPIFVNKNGQLAASFVEEVLVPGHGYSVYLRDERAGRAETVAAGSTPPRGDGHIVGELQTGAR